MRRWVLLMRDTPAGPELGKMPGHLTVDTVRFAALAARDQGWHVLFECCADVELAEAAAAVRSGAGVVSLDQVVQVWDLRDAEVE